ncbi:hypothetical protein [Geitlerinema sp. PCC 7407]|nr:hypothetical protein [Geitlerinema sp. PCC 7407]
MAVAKKKKTIAAIRKRIDAIAGNKKFKASALPNKAEINRAIANP